MKTAVYTRVSTEDQAREGYSLDVQREYLINYATQQGYEIYEIYSDEGISAGTTDRPALQKLLKDAKKKRFDLVLVYKIDRFSRRLSDLLGLVEQLESYGVGFKSATEPFDTTTSAGRLLFQQLGSFAEFERNRHEKRVFPGTIKSIQIGSWHGARYRPVIFFILMIFLISMVGCGQLSQDSGNRFNVPELSNWKKESSIRIDNIVSTSIIRLSSGQYRIFYPAFGGIGSSISSDGLTFVQEPGTRISKGSGSDYDVNSAKDPDVVTENNYYRMYYTAIGPDNKHRVMSAISTDGYTFTKEAGVRIDYSASYDQLADVQSVVKISDGSYKMYFVYDWFGDNSIKGATSNDGLSWEVASLSGFAGNCMDPEVILDSSGNLVMLFAAPRTASGPEPMDIYKATSTDGINWSVVGRALKPEKTEEGKIIGDPDVIKLPDNTFRVYYYGNNPQVHSYLLSATAESL